MGNCFRLGGWGQCRNQLKEAFVWTKKSADAGFGPGCAVCGMMYLEGKGCEQNKELADEYGKKAVESGDLYAIG